MSSNDFNLPKCKNIRTDKKFRLTDNKNGINKKFN